MQSLRIFGAFALLSLYALSASAASPFDGVYSGTYTKTKDASNRQNCASGGEFKVTVADGMLLWRARGDVTMVKIKDDGSFSEQAGAGFLMGQIVNRSLTANLTRGQCGYSWSMTR